MRSPFNLHAEIYGPQPARKVAGYFITRALLGVVIGIIGTAAVVM